MTDLPQSDLLILDLDRGWLTIWLNRPENRNALSKELAAALMETLQAVRDERAVRGVSIRGKGGTFCAGGDIKSFMAGLMGGASQKEIAAMNKSGGDLFQMIHSMPQVVIAVVDGAAIGGGMGLVCCADMVIAAGDAKFSLSETQLGIPPAQIAPYVVNRLGMTTAKRLMLTGARFDGANAKRIGLVDFVATDEKSLTEIENTIRADVMRCAPAANAATKALVHAVPHTSQDDIMELAANSFANCLLGDEGREGISAFVEKRKPNWASQEDQ